MELEDWVGTELSLLSKRIRPLAVGSHHSLFKYIGLNTKTSWDYLRRTLNECELLGSTPHALNDPFESKPRIFDDLCSHVADTLRPGRFIMQSDGVRIREGEEPSVEEMSDIARKAIQNGIQNTRVISFCDRSDSPLLWSHYSNSYKGACLHFLGRAFNPMQGRLGCVSYSKYRPALPLSLAYRLNSVPAGSSKTEFSAEMQNIMFFTKAEDWAYESEVRLVYNIRRNKVINFNKSGIVSIILGPLISDEDEKRIIKIVNESKLPTIQIRRAKLSANSFSIEIP